MYFRRKTSGGRAYLQIVASRREGDQVRQQVIATLGRYEDLKASGQLERLLRSGARFAEKAMVLGALDDDTAARIASRRIGPALVFERLWEETGWAWPRRPEAGRKSKENNDGCPGVRATPGGRDVVVATSVATNCRFRGLVAELGIERATPHDLRRTCLTCITRLGFGRDTMDPGCVDRVANHRTSKVTDVYDRHGYAQ
jgi:hypothetical protein